MVNLKTFDLTEKGVEHAFNEFMKTTRPKGQDAIKYSGNTIFVFHEVGDPVDAVDRLRTLTVELGKHRELALTYEIQVEKETIQYNDQESKLEKLIAEEEKTPAPVKGHKKVEGEITKNDLQQMIKRMKDVLNGQRSQINNAKGMLEIERFNISACENLIAEQK